MKSKRNYAVEYARRIARAVAKGISRSQARGHPKASEAAVSARRPAKPIEDDRLQVALKSLRQEKSLTAAAREAKVSPERLRRYASEKRHHRAARATLDCPPSAASTHAALFRGQNASSGGRRFRSGVQGRTFHVRRERLPANEQSGRPSRVRGHERRGHLREDPRLRDPSQRPLSARIRSRPKFRTHLPHRHLRRLTSGPA